MRKMKNVYDLNMELKSLNDNKISLDEAVKEFQSEADRYALQAEKKENMECREMMLCYFLWNI